MYTREKRDEILKKTFTIDAINLFDGWSRVTDVVCTLYTHNNGNHNIGIDFYSKSRYFVRLGRVEACS